MSEEAALNRVAAAFRLVSAQSGHEIPDGERQAGLRELADSIDDLRDYWHGLDEVSLDVRAVFAEWHRFFPHAEADNDACEFETESVRAWIHRSGRRPVLQALGATYGHFRNREPHSPGGRFAYFMAVCIGMERERGMAAV